MPRRYIVAIVGLATSVIVVGFAVVSINADIRLPAVPWLLLAGGLGVIVSAHCL